jgi:hypothetical protein
LAWTASLVERGAMLDSNSFSRLGRARIPKVVYDIRRFLECLTGLEGLWRFSFHLQHDGTIQHNNKKPAITKPLWTGSTRCGAANDAVINNGGDAQVTD